MKKITILIISIVVILYGIFFFYICSNPNLESFPAGTITDEDLLVLQKNVINSKKDSSSYPIILGTYYKNGLTLVEKHYCSDYCPGDRGRVYIVYQNINTKSECNEVNGLTITDSAWGGFVGCRPKIENSVIEKIKFFLGNL